MEQCGRDLKAIMRLPKLGRSVFKYHVVRNEDVIVCTAESCVKLLF